MADITVQCGAQQDIVEAFEDAIATSKSASDRIVLSRDYALVLQQSFRELEESEPEATAPDPPVFLRVKNPDGSTTLCQPRAIWLVAQPKGGDAVVSFSNGSVMQIEALQFQFFMSEFEKYATVIDVHSTQGIVKA